ncbi:MAG: glycosyltransferase family 4 protein [Flexilinea sp.]
MRIVIDLQACQSVSRFRGIGRYSSSLAKAIIRQASDHEVWIVLSDRFPETIPDIRADFDELIPREHIVTFSISGPVAEVNFQNAWRTRSAELVREYFLEGLNPDIVHVSSLFEGWNHDVVSSIGILDNDITTTATLYDLIPFVNQETYLPNQRNKDYYLRKIQSLKKASCLLAISDYSKQEAIKLLGFKEESIINISAAADTQFKPHQFSFDEKSVLFNHYNITKPFIMYAPGGFDERKNIIGLITAFSFLPDDIRSNHQLVITGKIHEESYKKIIRHARTIGLQDDGLVMTDFVTDDDLITLYNLCKLFVFPSFYEGFGLPALEAMACGAVVIASNTTSIPEVIGRTDALFDPTRPEEITRLMQLALKDECFIKNLREYESDQAKKFSWDNSAKKAISAFEELHNIKLADQKKILFNSDVNYKNLINSLAKINTTTIPTNLDLVKTASSIALSNPISDSRQILVDISVLVHGDAKSGIQRVVRSILLELLKSPPQGYKVKPIYFDDQRYRYANRFINVFLGNKETEFDDDVVDVACGDIYLGLDLSAHLTLAIHDYLKRLNILGVKLFFIIYDILLAKHPEWWPEGTGNIFLQWLESISEVSTGLVCISHSVAVEVQEWLNSNPPNRVEPLPIGFFHLGADIKNSAPTIGFPENAGYVLNVLKSDPSFLMVGTVEPRKGHSQTLSAFEALWEQGLYINLVIVGKRGWLVDNLVDRLSNHAMLGKHLFWLEGISDEYLERVYAASTCLVAASEAEGFGLPLIEAAQKKLPIIARDLPVFREVAGKHAFYFSGMSPENLAQAIKTWLDLFAHGTAPGSETLSWLTWKESAVQMLKAMGLN